MKLRLKGNSIRLRVTRSELQALKAGEPLQEEVNLGDSARLAYALAVDPQPGESAVRVESSGWTLHVWLRQDALQAWLAEDQVGVYGTLLNDSDDGLQVSLEKDFQCMDATAEENADAFVNPHSAMIC